jgi:NADH-quinone oxidoreductase subunit F
MPVLPGAIMMATDMDYDSIAKAGSMLGSGRRDRDGRHALHGEIAAAAARTSTTRNHAGSARPAAKGRVGCGVWSTASSTAAAGTRTSTCCCRSRTISPAARSARWATPAALPVKSFVGHFRDEFQHHIDHKQCLVPTYV